MRKYLKLFFSVFVIVSLLTYNLIFTFFDKPEILNQTLFVTLQKAILIGAICWFSIELLRILKVRLLKKYDINYEDNLKSRKLHTQVNLLEKVLVFIIIIIGIGLILLSIESIRKVGVGIFASAGVVGIIVGLSAQKIVGALLAGIQIAVTQPFRIDDAVVIENEWGWIEEINLTYIVVRIWDKRRLVLPTTYFLEKPFQNWTRTTADIIGTVFLYTDYKISFDHLREELDRVLDNTELWDGNVKVLQVTDSTQTTVESRILVSAKNSPTAWDLRVHVREKMIEFVQKNYPECLPRTRIELEKNITQ